VDVSEAVKLLAGAVSAIAAAFGAWVGYLQYRDRHARVAPATSEPQASPLEAHERDSAPRRRQGYGPPADADVVGPEDSDRDGARGDDQWNVEWTSEKLASRATVAVSAGVVSCLCLATMLITGVIVDADGSVDGAAAGVVQLASMIGIVAVLVATVMAIRVRRAARGRYRRPWRSATLALWLAWTPWVVGYLPLVELY
jgi:hypothetical protein